MIFGNENDFNFYCFKNYATKTEKNDHNIEKSDCFGDDDTFSFHTFEKQGDQYSQPQTDLECFHFSLNNQFFDTTTQSTANQKNTFGDEFSFAKNYN